MNAAPAAVRPLSFDPPVEDQEFDPDVEVNLAPAELLIVDDDEATLERLRLIAEDAGYEVRTACGGEEALQLLNERFCALLLTDIVMPVMSGNALCESIRRMRFQSYVYTIALSARDGAEDIVEVLDAGADDFLSKRATRSELLARLRAGRRVVGLEQALRQQVAENRKLCHVDALTGCFNRLYLMTALDQELGRCRQHGHWVSVLHCDVDDFRHINAAHGYGAGNELLQDLARRIKRAVAGERAAWMAYCGADEFVVVLPESSIERATASATAIRNDLADRPLTCSAGLVSVSVSIGICGASPGNLRQPTSAGGLLDAAEECARDARTTAGGGIVARVNHRPGAQTTRLGPRRRGH